MRLLTQNFKLSMVILTLALLAGLFSSRLDDPNRSMINFRDYIPAFETYRTTESRGENKQQIFKFHAYDNTVVEIEAYNHGQAEEAFKRFNVEKRLNDLQSKWKTYPKSVQEKALAEFELEKVKLVMARRDAERALAEAQEKHLELKEQHSRLTKEQLLQNMKRTKGWEKEARDLERELRNGR